MEIFYYIGAILFIRALYLFIFPWEYKFDIEEMANPIDDPIETIQKFSQNWIGSLIGFITVGWYIVGIIFSTDQRYLFILLILLLIVFSITLFYVKKDDRKKYQKFDDIITMSIVFFILLNHFYFLKN